MDELQRVVLVKKLRSMSAAEPIEKLAWFETLSQEERDYVVEIVRHEMTLWLSLAILGYK